MTQSPSPDWAEIRRRYEETDDATAEICAEAQIARADFDARRKREKWRRQNPRPFPPTRKPGTLVAPAEPIPAPDTPPPSPVPTVASGAPDALSALSNRRLLDRLVVAISMKLEQLERRMTKDLAAPETATAASSTDHDREARAIGALIDNIGKLTELETGHGNTANGRRTAAAATDLGHEAERIRRELAERLERIVEAAAQET